MTSKIVFTRSARVLFKALLTVFYSVIILLKGIIWMAWCKTDVSDFSDKIFSFKSARIFASAFQLSRKTIPCIFWLLCTLFLRKTKTKYWSIHNECNKAEQENFSQKRYRRMFFLLNWKAHAKIQAYISWFTYTHVPCKSVLSFHNWSDHQ